MEREGFLILVGSLDGSRAKPRASNLLQSLIGYQNLKVTVTLRSLSPVLKFATALWDSLTQGAADIFSLVHAPYTLKGEVRPHPQSHSSMSLAPPLVPMMLDCVYRRRHCLLRLMDMTSGGPARMFGIEGKGRIAVGYDADLTIVDMWRETLSGLRQLDCVSLWLDAL